MKPSVPSSQTRDPLPCRRTQANYFQLKAPGSSIEWINPVIKQRYQLTANYSIEDDLEPNMIISELIDHNPEVLTTTINSLDSSVLYVKSIIPSGGSQHC